MQGRTEMRICLLGDFSGTPDEGMKNVSRTTYDILSGNHDVMKINPRDVVKPRFFKKLRTFKPHIVHYLHGPTIRSLCILKLLRMLICPNAGIVVSATRPYFSQYTRRLIPLLKQDLVLTQSMKFEVFFKQYGWQVGFLPNGVDCRKFAPVDAGTKKRLRVKLGLPPDKRIVLHVGHLKQNRKLDLFIRIQEMKDVQVVVVGGTVEASDERLKDRLKDSGVRVIHEYLEDVSEIYKASDLYLFPIMDTTDKLPGSYNEIGAIDLPLSILEAMACNLPVITTPFGALPRLFRQGRGFEYAASQEDMIDKVKSFDFLTNTATREKVMPLDWNTIINKLETKYAELI